MWGQIIKIKLFLVWIYSPNSINHPWQLLFNNIFQFDYFMTSVAVSQAPSPDSNPNCPWRLHKVEAVFEDMHEARSCLTSRANRFWVSSQLSLMIFPCNISNNGWFSRNFINVTDRQTHTQTNFAHKNNDPTWQSIWLNSKLRGEWNLRFRA